jgi:hypothetical protein
MANPRVRNHLRFYAEDAGKRVDEYYQAAHWRETGDSIRQTPMALIGAQQFFLFEPCILRNNTVCMPFEWFKREGKIVAKAWNLHSVDRDVLAGESGWVVNEYESFEVEEQHFVVSFGSWDASGSTHGLPRATSIIGDPNLLYVKAESNFSKQDRAWINPRKLTLRGPGPTPKTEIGGVCLPKELEFTVFLSGCTATIHLGINPRSGTNITRSYLLRLAYLVSRFIKNTMFISCARQTLHRRWRCLMALLTSLSSFYFCCH